MTLSAFDQEAIHMLTRASMKPTTGDVILLADDLQAVSDDIHAGMQDDGSDQGHAYAAMVELKARIGGLENLDSYMKCLRVPAHK